MGISFGKTNYRQICQMLKLVYQDKNMTRSRISSTLDIDRAMVTHIYQYLVKEGWIKEQPTNLKKLPLRLCENKLFAAGIEIQPEYQILTICNIAGTIVFEHKWNNKIKSVSDFILNTACPLLETSEYEVAGAAIAIPGICDTKQSSILRSVPFNIKESITLHSEISVKGKNIPLYVENDIRCWSWGKVSFNKEYDSFMTVIQHFIEDKDDKLRFSRITGGLSFFINGKPMLGAHGCAGEMPVLFKVKELQDTGNYLTYEQRLEVRSNKEIAKQFLENTAITLSYLSTVFDAKKIFISGFEAFHTKDIENSIKNLLKQYQFYPDLQHVEIISEASKPEETSRGACGLVFEELFVRDCETEALDSRLIAKK